MRRPLHNAFNRLSITALLGTVCFTAALACASSAAAQTTLKQSDAISGQEALSLRRIIEFWKDQDYAASKKQILSFLEKYKESKARDQLYAMLGDLYMHEGNTTSALNAYEEIHCSALMHKTALQRAECYFEMQKFDKAFQAAEMYGDRVSFDHNSKLRWNFLMAETLMKKAESAEDSSARDLLWRKALEHYASLKNSRYSDLALFSMADVMIKLGERSQAAAIYENLAEAHPDKKEALLFQAARCSLSSDPLETARILGSIASSGGSHAQTAAYDTIQLYFKNKKYEECFSAFEKFRGCLSQDKLPLTNYMAGKSLFMLNKKLEAAELLSAYAESQTAPSPYLKSALNTLLHLGVEGESLELTEKALKALTQFYSHDDDRAEALVLHAQLCMQEEKYQEALKDIDTLLSAFPSYSQKELLTLDRGLLLYYSENYPDAHKTFASFVDAYSDSKEAATAQRFAIQSSLLAMKNCPAEKETELNRQLIEDLDKALSMQNQFSEADQNSILKLFFETMLKNGREKEALAWLDDNGHRFSQEQLDEVRMLHTQSLIGLSQDPEQFIPKAEASLSKSPEKYAALHIPLYNAYISLARKQEEKEASYSLEKAADHLYSAFKADPAHINQDNLQWLANYFYIRAHDAPQAVERGIAVFDYLLSDSANAKGADYIAIEENSLKSADLLEISNDALKEQAVLEKLCGLYKEHPQADWKFQKRAFFQLAQLYPSHETEKALALYRNILSLDHTNVSYFTDAAVLQSSKILFSKLSPSERKEDNTAIQEILQNLKDLQIKRQLVSEPLHIEAALEYAGIRGSLVEPIVQKERKIFFYKRILDDYSANSYREDAAYYPQQCETLENYLSFIQAEIARLESEIADTNAQKEKAIVLKGQAKKDLDSLAGQESRLTTYLFSKVQESLEALR